MEQSAAGETGKLTFRIPGIRAPRIPLSIPRPKNELSSALFLVYGYAGLILVGTLLLILPVSSSSGRFTPPLDALFTATSAVAVTGLVVVDTGTYWSTFGQATLLALFQIGGLAFITGATLILTAMARGFGLRERLIVAESIGMDTTGSVLGVVARVTVFSLVIEGLGVAVFYSQFTPADYADPSLWTAVFHAVSAFNNCGMDLFGNFKSMLDYQGNSVVLLTTVLLVFLGGISYLVMEDVLRKRSFLKLSLNSKLVLITTSSLLVLGTLFYLVNEFAEPATLGLLSFPNKVLVSFFQAVVPRTAGFTAVDVAGYKESSLFFTMFLMTIGGAAGSAAGGIKVNALGVLALTVISSLRSSERVEAFGRELIQQNVYRALVLLVFFLVIIGFVVTALSVTEEFAFDSILFETFSALGTVGLSTGITPDLSAPGKLIIIVTMFIGRLGPLTFMAALTRRPQMFDRNYPHETIRIG